MDGHDLGMTGDPVHAAVDGQLAKRPPERLVRVVVDVLVAEEDHVVFGDGGMQLVDLPIAQRLGEVDAEDLGADHPGDRTHVQHFIAHGAASNGLSP